MTTRSEREKAQKLNEQHQAILSKLLREEDNKYCADCEAKGKPGSLCGMTRCNEEGTCPLKGTASIINVIQLASYCKVILMGVTCVQQCLHPTFRFDASYELCKPDVSSPFISML